MPLLSPRVAAARQPWANLYHRFAVNAVYLYVTARAMPPGVLRHNGDGYKLCSFPKPDAV